MNDRFAEDFAKIFDFMKDGSNIDERMVARDEFSWGFVSTVRVSDGSQPYETAVKHPDYNEGHIITVEAYSTPEAALTRHADWVKTMENPPDALVDCANSAVGQIMVMLGDHMIYPRKKS